MCRLSSSKSEDFLFLPMQIYYNLSELFTNRNVLTSFNLVSLVRRSACQTLESLVPYIRSEKDGTLGLQDVPISNLRFGCDIFLPAVAIISHPDSLSEPPHSICFGFEDFAF